MASQAQPNDTSPKHPVRGPGGQSHRLRQGAKVPCAHCGKPLRIESIWCRHCGTPNAIVAARLVDENTSELAERMELYRRMLEDLDRPEFTTVSDTAKHQSVREYCQAQLHRFQNLQSKQTLWEARRELVAKVKSVAHRPDVAGALRLCTQPAKLPSDDPIVVRLRTELQERLADEQQKRAVAQMLELRLAAQQLVQRGMLEAAEAKLQSALKLQPDDRTTQESLKRVVSARSQKQQAAAAARAAAETAQIPAPPAPVQAIVAQATLVRPGSIDPQRPTATASAAGLHAEAGQDEARGASEQPQSPAPSHSFTEAEEDLHPTQRQIEAFSQWTLIRPFLMDNVGWFVGAFLVVAGFVVLIVTFWNTIEQNQILLHSLVYGATLSTTGLFFALAYFMRLKYPRLESSSDTLLVIVALLIPLVFAAAMLTALIPASLPADAAVSSIEHVRAP